MSFKRVVFDIEANDLYKPWLNQRPTKLHSLVVRCMRTNEVVSCAEQPGYEPIRKGISLIESAKKVIGHNIIEYDLPVLYELAGLATVLESKIIDTLVGVRLVFAHIKETDYKRMRRGRLPGYLIGKQSLEAWGYRLGVHKGEYKLGWEEWTPEMQVYCERDTDVNRLLWKRILKRKFSSQSMRVEHDMAFYLWQQQQNGVPFDIDAAIDLNAKISAEHEEVGDRMRERFGSWIRPGKEFTPKRNNKTRGYVAGCTMTKLNWIEFKPTSRDHIADRLMTLYGWKPEEFTDTGKPQVDEVTLKGLSYPEIPDLRRMLLLQKRMGQITSGREAWLKHTHSHPITKQQHIHHHCTHNATITHRGAHSNPNLGQVPKVKSPMGPECRALFCVPRKWDMLGSDAEGLELRMLAHFMGQYDGGEFAKVLLEGDIHELWRESWGMTEREKGKTETYAFLYGAGNKKLGKIYAVAENDKKALKNEEALARCGKAQREKVKKKLPALKYLLDSLDTDIKRGYIIAIDGRRVYIRHKHAVLNTLLQSAGSIAVKYWMTSVRRQLLNISPDGWKFDWASMLWTHDEIQLATRPSITQVAKRYCIDTMPKVGEMLGFNIPLAADVKIGKNWKETH